MTTNIDQIIDQIHKIEELYKTSLEIRELENVLNLLKLISKATGIEEKRIFKLYEDLKTGKKRSRNLYIEINM